jgi:transcriptional regulator with XRE-family HTH domain
MHRTSIDAEAIAERLTRLRKEHGLTQVELADRLGLVQAHVSAYERGVVRLHAELIAQLSEIFGVSADELIGIKTSSRSPEPLKTWKLRKRLREIEQLPRRELDAVIQTLDGFLAKHRERQGLRRAARR